MGDVYMDPAIVAFPQIHSRSVAIVAPMIQPDVRGARERVHLVHQDAIPGVSNAGCGDANVGELLDHTGVNY
jgi:hypothetical protein